MNQFKNMFLEKENISYSRAYNSQLCIRAGGKHNDFEDIGKDGYHHTIFEMLGSWSFDNFSKEEVINYAYDLLINVFKLDSNRIYITYFGGNKLCKSDEETKKIWEKYFDNSRILSFDHENFWMMDKNGPCGPCTEIHYDLIGNRECVELVNKNDNTVIELWNLVFIQYNRVNNKLIELKNKYIDTGMGFERLVCIIQNKMSNYLTDIFMDIFSVIQDTLVIKEYSDKDDLNISYRIIADHLRTVIFAISDNIIPNNKKRGYVLRKIIRRLLLHIYKINNSNNKYIIKELTNKVIKILNNNYSIYNKDLILETLILEEQKFYKLMEKGKRIITKMLSKNKILSEQDRFILYDTHGINPELIDDIIKSLPSLP